MSETLVEQVRNMLFIDSIQHLRAFYHDTHGTFDSQKISKANDARYTTSEPSDFFPVTIIICAGILI
jgi:hypothetical protein